MTCHHGVENPWEIHSRKIARSPSSLGPASIPLEKNLTESTPFWYAYLSTILYNDHAWIRSTRARSPHQVQQVIVRRQIWIRNGVSVFEEVIHTDFFIKCVFTNGFLRISLPRCQLAIINIWFTQSALYIQNHMCTYTDYWLQATKGHLSASKPITTRKKRPLRHLSTRQRGVTLKTMLFDLFDPLPYLSRESTCDGDLGLAADRILWKLNDEKNTIKGRNSRVSSAYQSTVWFSICTIAHRVCVLFPLW